MNLPIGDPRRSERSKMFVAATVRREGAALPVVLRDLSEYGALVRIECTLGLDSEVRLQRDELDVQGYVAWEHDGYAGIVFSEPLKHEALLEYVSSFATRH